MLAENNRLLKNIASSINQIAVRVNSTDNIYRDDIEELKDKVERLWRELKFTE